MQITTLAFNFFFLLSSFVSNAHDVLMFQLHIIVYIISLFHSQSFSLISQVEDLIQQINKGPRRQPQKSASETDQIIIDVQDFDPDQLTFQVGHFNCFKVQAIRSVPKTFKQKTEVFSLYSVHVHEHRNCGHLC